MDIAHIEEEKQLAKMEKKITAIYTRAEKEINASWQEYMTNVEKDVQNYQKAYDEAKKIGDKDLIKKTGKDLSNAQKDATITNARYQSVVEQTAKELSNVNEIATAYINGQLPETYLINYNYIGKKIENQVKGYSFNLLDQNTIKDLITRDKLRLPYKEIDKEKDVAWNIKKINGELTQGILQGESIPKIAKRLSNVERMNSEASVRTARTMVTSAENEGRIDMMKDAEKDGIILKKKWLSTRGNRTREWHAELNGVEKSIDEPFENDFGKIMYPGDPSADGANVYNCRCTLTTEIKGLR